MLPHRRGKRWDSAATRALAMVLLQPALVLIDHGHFQYNSVCLGLAMAAAAAVAGGKRRGGETVFGRSRDDACMHALPSLLLSFPCVSSFSC